MPLAAENTDEVAGRLLAHGILPTPQRIDIAALFFAGHLHLSADQVIARLAQEGRPVSKATVYNTLGLLAERGLLAQVSVDSTRTFYDSNTRPHYHFYNVDDGELMDVEAGLFPLESLPPPPPGTATDGVDIVIRIRNRPPPGD